MLIAEVAKVRVFVRRVREKVESIERVQGEGGEA